MRWYTYGDDKLPDVAVFDLDNNTLQLITSGFIKITKTDDETENTEDFLEQCRIELLIRSLGERV